MILQIQIVFYRFECSFKKYFVLMWSWHSWENKACNWILYLCANRNLPFKHASSFNLSLFVWSRFSDTQFSKKIRSSAIFCMSLRYFAFNLSKDTKIYFLSMSVPNAPWNESILFASYIGFLKILIIRLTSPVSHKKTYLYVSNCRIYEYSVIFIYFQCLCPCWLSQFYTLKKKLGIGCVNIRKFVNSTHTK